MASVIDPGKTRLVKTIIRDRVGLWCAALDGTGKKLYIGTTDFTIHVHDLPGLEPSKAGPLKGHASYVTALAWLPQSRHLVSGSFDKQLLWWQPDNGTGPERKVNVGARINRLGASPDGKRLAAATDDRVGRVWDAHTGQLQVQLRDGHPATTRLGRHNPLYSIAYSPDGRLLATGDRAGTICFWEAGTGKLVRRAAAPVFYSQAISQKAQASEYEWGGVRSLAFTPDGKMLVAGGMGPADQNSAGTDGAARLEAFDVATGKSMAAFTVSGSKGLLMSMVFHPDREWLIAAGGGGQNGIGYGEIFLWAPGQRDKTGKPVAPVFHKSPSVLREVVLTSDGRTALAVGTQRELTAGRIEVWDLTGKEPAANPAPLGKK
jgi:WD40 repeat protein